MSNVEAIPKNDIAGVAGDARTKAHDKKEADLNIEIRFRGLESSRPLRQHIVRRIHFHLDRFRPDLTSVRVRIGDVNGPKGGLDKRCQFDVRGPRLGSAIIEEYSSDVWSAVDVAVRRTVRTVARRLDKIRTYFPDDRWSGSAS